MTRDQAPISLAAPGCGLVTPAGDRFPEPVRPGVSAGGGAAKDSRAGAERVAAQTKPSVAGSRPVRDPPRTAGVRWCWAQQALSQLTLKFSSLLSAEVESHSVLPFSISIW